MYKKAIEKLEQEIMEKENLINNIKNFDNLSLSDKIKTIKNCSLRYERQEMPKILQKDFKSDILRNATSCHIGVNHFYIQHDIFVFKVGLYNGNIIEIESEDKLIDENNLKDIVITTEDRNLWESLNSFINYPTFKEYKKLIPKLKKKVSLINCLEYFLNNKGLIQRLTKKRDDINDYILYREDYNMNNEEKLKNNKALKERCEKYLSYIEEDLNYFKENNYNISCKFNRQLF